MIDLAFTCEECNGELIETETETEVQTVTETETYTEYIFTTETETETVTETETSGRCGTIGRFSPVEQHPAQSIRINTQ